MLHSYINIYNTLNELVLKEIMEIMPKFKDELSKLIKELENRVK